MPSASMVGAGPLVMSQYRGPGPSLFVAGQGLHQSQVELDDVWADDVQQGKGVQIASHVVEGDGESVIAQRGDFA